ncbi:hypothetical protein DY000_02035792 [Brassica cretica]|uniref:Uncharacterized protein n=1 Tax=Brassica cretica TaxID=69181 RepID=A0ABQ7DRK6_BRACR|nr:hypothetical protein DY000_02035792 [Brassica cretica]
MCTTSRLRGGNAPSSISRDTRCPTFKRHRRFEKPLPVTLTDVSPQLTGDGITSRLPSTSNYPSTESFQPSIDQSLSHPGNINTPTTLLLTDLLPLENFKSN